MPVELFGTRWREPVTESSTAPVAAESIGEVHAAQRRGGLGCQPIPFRE